jgi:hypothetical protein
VDATNSHIKTCGTGISSKFSIAPFRMLFVIFNRHYYNCKPLGGIGFEMQTMFSF